MKGVWIRSPTCRGPKSSPQLLAREELRRGRTSESLAVAVLDLDGLGSVNKRHGAAVGYPAADAPAPRCCSQTVRGVDEIARTGPDEFSVLLHATDAERAADVGGALRRHARRLRAQHARRRR